MGTIIQWVLYGLTATIPLVFALVNYELFEFPKFLILLAGAGIIAIAWTVDAIVTRKLRVIRPSPIKSFVWLQWAVLGVLATQTIATLFSIHPYTSYWGYYSRFHQGLLSTLCYTIIFFAAVNWLDKKSVQKILNISLKTSIIVSIIAILEHYNVSLTCVIMTFFAHLNDPQAEFTFRTACWGANTNPLNRAFATIGQPNWLAAYIVPHIFVAFAKLRSHKQLIVRILVTAIYMTALIVTKSKSGFLAFVGAYCAYWLTSMRSVSWQKIKQSFFATCAIIVVVFCVAGTPYTPPIVSLLKRQSTPVSTELSSGTVLETGGTNSGIIRKIVWTGTFNLIRNHLLIGTGPETFAYTYYWERPAAHNYTSEWDFLYNKAHNEYLNMAATTGLIGVIAYLIWHLAIGAVGLSEIPPTKKTDKTDEDELKALLPVVTASIVAFSISNFFGFSVVSTYFVMTLISALPLAATTESSTTHSTVPLAVYGYTASAILIYCYFVPVRLFVADYYYTIGKAKNSLPYLEKAVLLRPQEDLFHSALAEAYAAQAGVANYRDRALQESALTKEHNPYHLNFYKSRVKVLLVLAATNPAYYEDAAAEFVRARQLAPTDPKLAYNLGLIYSRMGDIEKAETQINQAIELKKNYQDAYYALTLLYEQTKQTDKIPSLLQTAESNLATYSATLKAKIDQYTR